MLWFERRFNALEQKITGGGEGIFKRIDQRKWYFTEGYCILLKEKEVIFKKWLKREAKNYDFEGNYIFKG